MNPSYFFHFGHIKDIFSTWEKKQSGENGPVGEVSY